MVVSSTGLAEVMDTCSTTREEDTYEITVPKILPDVKCNGELVREVFFNLITNALKYNESENKVVEVGYIQDKDGDAKAYTFYVRDNGIGIPEKHIDSIFDIFKRLHGRDKFGGGTGAGLTIAKKIVERHGGEIWAESKLGEGTTFLFTLSNSEDPDGLIESGTEYGTGGHDSP
ncbi:MAG: hypothetical protein IID15_03315 [Candidatus Marinimicrobia bacterium]|nr:hypothetical protein [Candidatus Neomarinimicrobiota bacterium]